jgi:hypothetical protein
LIKRRGYSRIQRPGLIGLVLRSAPCRNRTCSPVIKSLLLLPGQRQIIFEHYGTPWRLLLRKSPRSKMLTKSEPLSSPFFVGASVRAVHPTRLERVTYSSGVCSFLNLKSGFDSRRGQDAQHQQVERVTMFYRSIGSVFAAPGMGPFQALSSLSPFGDARLQDGKANANRIQIVAVFRRQGIIWRLKVRKVQRLPVPLAGAPPGGISVFISTPGA